MDTSRLSGADLLVALKIASLKNAGASVRQLGQELGMSKSSVAQSLHRLRARELLRKVESGRQLNRLALRDCLEHAARWIAPAEIGDYELGLPTAHASEPLSGKLLGDADPLVMPLAHGPVRGRAVTPLHPLAPKAAQRDPALYRLLALVDALRIGRARERAIASAELAASL